MDSIAVDIKELKQKKDNEKLIIPKILVADVESTGLDSFPTDLVLSIGIAEVDVINHTVDPLFNKILGYDTTQWDLRKKQAWIFSNSPLELEQVQHAYDKGQTADIVAKEFNELVNKRHIAFYNKSFDYGNYLSHSPFVIDPMYLLPCLMLASTEPAAIPNRWHPGYKWPTLSESFEIFLDKELKKDLLAKESFHDALYDSVISGWIMLFLIDDGHYNLLKYISEF